MRAKKCLQADIYFLLTWFCSKFHHLNRCVSVKMWWYNGSHLYGGHEEAPHEVKLSIDRLRVHCVMLSLLGCIPDNLYGFDALVVFTAPVQDPHLVKMWDVVKLDWVFIRHHNLHMSTDTPMLQTVFQAPHNWTLPWLHTIIWEMAKDADLINSNQQRVVMLCSFAHQCFRGLH